MPMIASAITASSGHHGYSSPRGDGSDNLVAKPLRAQSQCSHREDSDTYVAVAFTERSRDAGRTLEAQEELSYALTNPGGGGRAHCRSIMSNMVVRRLTPIECSRLQGFPDDWLDVEYNGKPMSDSARYRMLGNAVAVPVAEWIGTRIRRRN